MLFWSILSEIGPPNLGAPLIGILQYIQYEIPQDYLYYFHLSYLYINAENGFLFHHVPETDIRFKLMEHSNKISHQMEVSYFLHRDLKNEYFGYMLQFLVITILIYSYSEMFT